MWTEKVLPRVQRLGQGIRDGEEIVMKKKKQLSVDTETDGVECKDSVGSELVTKIKAVSTTPAIDGARAMACRIERIKS